MRKQIVDLQTAYREEVAQQATADDLSECAIKNLAL